MLTFSAEHGPKSGMTKTRSRGSIGSSGTRSPTTIGGELTDCFALALSLSDADQDDIRAFAGNVRSAPHRHADRGFD